MITTYPVRWVPVVTLAAACLVMTSCSDALSDGASPTPTETTSTPTKTTGTSTETEMRTEPEDTATTTVAGTSTPTPGGTGSPSTTDPTGTRGSGVPTSGSTPQPATVSPPVGIPGGVPGAAPLSEESLRALTAAATAEAEMGGMPYVLSRGPSHWIVMVKLWDGGREVRVSDDGTSVEAVTPVAVDDDVALMLDTVVVRMAEAAEVAVADRPGDITAVAAVESEGAWTWQVTVQTGSGVTRVAVDVGSGAVVGAS